MSPSLFYRKQRKEEVLKIPGEKCGPMGLPVSYTKDQLEAYGWNAETSKFSSPPRGGWKSKLHEGQWGPQAPRTRKPSFYWKTRS